MIFNGSSVADQQKETNMNDWQIEMLIRTRRDEIEREIKEARLANSASDMADRGPGIHRLTLVRLADWLIRTGRKLRRHESLSPEYRRIIIDNLDCICGSGVSGGLA
jgi:hypothetical protein